MLYDHRFTSIRPSPTGVFRSWLLWLMYQFHHRTAHTDCLYCRNWIYVDRQTYEVKFGTRAWAEPNFKGPFDCTRQDRRLTLGGWEGFVAVKEGNFWALYFDLEGDRLRSKVAEGTPVLEVELQRIEMRVPKPEIPKQETNGGEGKPEEAKQKTNGDQQDHKGEEGNPAYSVKLESPEVD